MSHQHIETSKCGSHTIKIFYDLDCESPREWCNVGKLAVVPNRYVPGDEKTTRERLEEIQADKELLSLPVYCYAHSGTTVSTQPFGCRFDSGLCGVLYAPMGAEGMTPEGLRERLEGEIQNLAAYLEGRCYGYTVEDAKGEQIESCWGFVGDLPHVKREALEVAQWLDEARSRTILAEVEAAAAFLGVDLAA